MGAKKEALILKALEERKRHAGRHLLADAHDAAAALVGYLREHAPDAPIDAVGSLRRGCETCGDLDILASGAPASLMDAFAGYPLVERVLAHGDTKSSVLLRGGFQADLRLVAADSRGAALQYFTGSKAHNIALRDRAIGLGFKLNEYGLFRVEDDATRGGRHRRRRVRGARPGVDAAGAAGETAAKSRRPRRRHAAAADRARRPARRPAHAHDRDRRQGRHRDDGCGGARGAASSTSPSPTTASRWRWRTAWTSGARSSMPPASARLMATDGIRLLAGIECDIRPDGTLDLATTASPRSISSSRRCTRRSTRIASR